MIPTIAKRCVLTEEKKLVPNLNFSTENSYPNRVGRRIHPTIPMIPTIAKRCVLTEDARRDLRFNVCRVFEIGNLWIDLKYN
jgi:hypothetical protein